MATNQDHGGISFRASSHVTKRFSNEDTKAGLTHPLAAPYTPARLVVGYWRLCSTYNLIRWLTPEGDERRVPQLSGLPVELAPGSTRARGCCLSHCSPPPPPPSPFYHFPPINFMPHSFKNTFYFFSIFSWRQKYIHKFQRDKFPKLLVMCTLTGPFEYGDRHTRLYLLDRLTADSCQSWKSLYR